MQIDEVVCLNSEDVVTIVIRNETYHNRGILPAETPINPKDPRIKKYEIMLIIELVGNRKMQSNEHRIISSPQPNQHL